jgi:sugar/nucleoside kinase (ribokinase family)
LRDLKILVIGGASLDTLAGADELVPGGAGMYTAMSAQRSGAEVTLYAPRPVPIPEELLLVNDSLTWLGPAIEPADLAHFEIHYDDGRANYVESRFGTEDSLSIDELPDDLSEFNCIHLSPLGDIRRQQIILRSCRERGARRISAGTALGLINAHPDVASEVLQEADILFMNEEEAIRLFGSMSAVRSRTDQLIIVTQGRDGATVVQGESQTALAGVAATLVDPTGAGDTFCGATLVGIASGLHPVMAARRAMPLAAQMTEQIGPAALLRGEAAPEAVSDARVVVDGGQIQRVAGLIKTLTAITPFPFVGPDLPDASHPAALDYFFASTLQQFGFWTHTDGRYQRPLVAHIDGEERKGAFYFFRAYCRWLKNDPEKLSPAAQAELSRADLLAVLRDDDGNDPVPSIDLHLSLAHAYGRDMLALGYTPKALMEKVNSSAEAMNALLAELDHIGGYKEDPLRKKAALLAIILQQRPEAFLHHATEDAPPIVDYHVMRSCLRIGLIDVVDTELAARLAGRMLLSDADEWAVRSAAFTAIEQLVATSGKSMGAVDWFLFQARQRCPEMSDPLCGACAVDPICAHRKDLFQPVRRTSFY